MDQVETIEPIAVNKNNIAVTYGLITAGAVIAWSLILYVAGVEWYTGVLAYVAILIPIVLGVLGGLKQKALQGGYLSFKQALRTVFLIFIIFIIVETLFNYVLLNVIDVPFREAVMQDAAVKMEKFMTKMGAPQDTIDKALEDMNNPKNFTPGKLLLGVFFRFVIWFIGALIIAAIIKKKKPEFENQF